MATLRIQIYAHWTESGGTSLRISGFSAPPLLLWMALHILSLNLFSVCQGRSRLGIIYRVFQPEMFVSLLLLLCLYAYVMIVIILFSHVVLVCLTHMLWVPPGHGQEA